MLFKTETRSPEQVYNQAAICVLYCGNDLKMFIKYIAKAKCNGNCYPNHHRKNCSNIAL
jgi:hypothetical protein